MLLTKQNWVLSDNLLLSNNLFFKHLLHFFLNSPTMAEGDGGEAEPVV